METSRESPETVESPETTARQLKLRLYLMMFLQYFVQGCYLPIISVYLGEALKFDGEAINFFGAALAVGPLVAPFILGQIVDRHISTQKVLAFCHLTGGAVMLILYTQISFWPVLILGTLYSILYIPSLMLTNSLTFHHLVNRDREFPLIRLWGTIGFIVPAWLIEMYWLAGMTGEELNDARGVALLLAGLSGLIMGLYSITLPDTPPPGHEIRDFAPGKVIGLLRYRHFLVLVVISFGIAIVHKFYFVWNGPFIKSTLRAGGIEAAWTQRISSIGQIAEVAVMVALAFFIARLGFKGTMLIGALAYFARCVIFAAASGLEGPFELVMTLVCIGQALHGLCFACFLATAYMYVDRMTPKDVRGSAQNLYGTFVIGLGFFVGGLVGSRVAKLFETPLGERLFRDQLGFSITTGLQQFENAEGITIVRDWIGIWIAGAVMAAICVIGFALFFPKRTLETDEDVAQNPESPNLRR